MRVYPQVSKVRELMKRVGAILILCDQFRPLQIALGVLLKEAIEVPSLDVETISKAMFVMILAYMKHRKVFSELCNTTKKDQA